MNYPPEDVGGDCSTREGLTIFVFDFNRTIIRNRNDYYAIAMVWWIAPRRQYSRWRPTQWITCFDYCDSFCTACTLRTCAHGLAAIFDDRAIVTGYRKRLTEVTKRSIPLRSMWQWRRLFWGTVRLLANNYHYLLLYTEQWTPGNKFKKRTRNFSTLILKPWDVPHV